MDSTDARIRCDWILTVDGIKHKYHNLTQAEVLVELARLALGAHIFSCVRLSTRVEHPDSLAAKHNVDQIERI